ncbi:Uncharacterised protein [Streptococcus pneumoniae]|nr:Uncharacterised protein [Streptococcus pneumoniae]
MVGFGEGLLKGWQAIDTKIADILLKRINIRLTEVSIQISSKKINQILLTKTVTF